MYWLITERLNYYSRPVQKLCKNQTKANIYIIYKLIYKYIYIYIYIYIYTHTHTHINIINTCENIYFIYIYMYIYQAKANKYIIYIYIKNIYT